MTKYLPLRKFIYDRLYHPRVGYFCRQDFQVGELSTPINFKKHLGYDDYQRELYEKYPKNAWLTPSQIFKPYYGMTIGNYIKQAHQIHCKKYKQKDRIRIVEGGAGTGSAAQSILYYFQNFQQQEFRNLQYSIVELSSSLCSHLEKKLRKTYPKLFQTKQIKIINQDIAQYASQQHFYLLFFEVLDNMPHDKVIWNSQQNKYDRFSVVDLDTNQESFQPIEKDQLVRKCLQLYLKMDQYHEVKPAKSSMLDLLAQKILNTFMKPTKNSKDIFIPTFMFNFLENLSKKAPNAHLVLSDFDSLISSIPGINAPIVSRKGEKSAQKNDYDTYLVNRGQADIFFPIDFHFLRVMHRELLKRDANVVKSHEFIDEFSLPTWTLSKSGFNPIKEDFSNTSFLTSKI